MEQQKDRDFLFRQWLEHWSSPPKSVGRHEGRVGRGEPGMGIRREA